MSVVTLALAKSWLQIAHTAQDDVVQMLLNGVEDELSKLLHLSFTSRTVTEDLGVEATEFPSQQNAFRRVGTGVSVLLPTVKPVTALTTILDRYASDAAAYGIVQDDMIYRSDDALRVAAGTFAAGPKRYRVTYTAGYSALPDGLTRAVLMLVDNDYRARGGEMSASAGGVSKTFRSRPELLKSISAQYSRASVIV